MVWLESSHTTILSIMKFIEEIKEAAKSLYNAGVAKLQEWKQKVKIRLKKWKARLSYILAKFGITVYRPEYTSNPVDDELRKKCQQFIDEEFPNGLIQRLEGLSQDERLELMRNTVFKGADIYDVHVSQVKFFYPSNELEMYMNGFYNREEDAIYLNAYFINELDTPERTERLLKTIFHELKHARQFAAVFDNKDYGYSDELILTWALNIKYYVDWEDNMEAYSKQPIEADAFGWADSLDTHANSL